MAALAPAARNLAEANRPIARFLERHGLRDKRAADKAVPSAIFRLPRLARDTLCYVEPSRALPGEGVTWHHGP